MAAFLAFANLPWDFVYLLMTQSRKVRASVPIFSYGERDVSGLDVE